MNAGNAKLFLMTITGFRRTRKAVIISVNIVGQNKDVCGEMQIQIKRKQSIQETIEIEESDQ